MARISRRAWCARIVNYLRSAAEQEENRCYWDDYCIAWMTVAKAFRGESHPHFWATYEHLGTAPEQVWSMLQAQKRRALGRLYAEWYDAAGNRKPGVPKKPAGSIRSPQEEVAAKNTNPALDRNSSAGTKGE